MPHNPKTLTASTKTACISCWGIISLTFTLLLLSFQGANAATLSVPGGFKTIREAIEKAAPYDTITVEPGVYTENVVIKKPVVLNAPSGALATTVAAAVKGEPVFKAIDVSGVTINGFTATGSGVAGIFLYNVSNSVITENTAVKNSSGIVINRSNGNVIARNTANRNDNYGISIDASNGNRIEKNIANENDDKGFFINDSDDNRITENTANVNTWNGITIYSSDKNVITDNMTLRNTFGLVISESKDNTESGNTTVPNIFIIFPILLVYIGVISYLVQKNILKLIYR